MPSRPDQVQCSKRVDRDTQHLICIKKPGRGTEFYSVTVHIVFIGSPPRLAEDVVCSRRSFPPGARASKRAEASSRV